MANTPIPKLLIQAAIDSFRSTEPEDLNEYIDTLRHILPENLLLASLDLVDRDCVIKFKTPWGNDQYRVEGSTSTYHVFPGVSPEPTSYCTCLAFAYNGLLSNSDSMPCKHLLATMISMRMSKCVDRTVSLKDLAIVCIDSSQ